MDIQELLQGAGIEVDTKTIQNPTVEFMIHLVTEFLKRLNFDGSEIAKPTPEQLERACCEEALDVVKAINLHAALATMSERIFLKDLTLADIMSPGFKKTSKRIKVLLNFVAYVKSKRMEKEPQFEELDNRHQEMQSLVEQKFETIAKIGSTINERENRVEYADQLKQEIAQVVQQIEEGKRETRKLHQEVEKVSGIHQEKLQDLHALQAKAHELHKVSKDLQAKVVKSPEDYLAKTNELKAILEQKMEERQSVSECIVWKRNQIKKNEQADAEVNHCLSKVMGLGTIMQDLSETATQLQSLKNEINELNVEIQSLERQSITLNEEATMSMSMHFEKTEKLLCELEKSLLGKQKERDVLEKKLEKSLAERDRLSTTLKKEKELIATTEKESNLMLKDLEAHFIAKLAEELDFRKTLEQLSDL